MTEKEVRNVDTIYECDGRWTPVDGIASHGNNWNVTYW